MGDLNPEVTELYEERFFIMSTTFSMGLGLILAELRRNRYGLSAA